MAFDEKKFMNANFTPRTKDVKVPDLKDFLNQIQRRSLRSVALPEMNWPVYTRQLISTKILQGLWLG